MIQKKQKLLPFLLTEHMCVLSVSYRTYLCVISFLQNIFVCYQYIVCFITLLLITAFILSIQSKRFAGNSTCLQFNEKKECLTRSRNCFAFDCFVLFDFVLCLVCPMLSVSLDSSFLTVPSLMFIYNNIELASI